MSVTSMVTGEVFLGISLLSTITCLDDEGNSAGKKDELLFIYVLKDRDDDEDDGDDDDDDGDEFGLKGLNGV